MTPLRRRMASIPSSEYSPHNGTHLPQSGMNLSAARDAFFRDVESRSLSQSSMANYGSELASLCDSAAFLGIAYVSIEDVSTLLGHISVRTTEKHYAPWDRSRRDRLTRVMRDALLRDLLLKELCGGRTKKRGRHRGKSTARARMADAKPYAD